jgi:hypothetical protein
LIVAPIAWTTARDRDIEPPSGRPNAVCPANDEQGTCRIVDNLHVLAFRNTKNRLFLDGRRDRTRQCPAMTAHLRAIVFRGRYAASCGQPIITMRTTGITTASDRMKK